SDERGLGHRCLRPARTAGLRLPPRRSRPCSSSPPASAAWSRPWPARWPSRRWRWRSAPATGCRAWTARRRCATCARCWRCGPARAARRAAWRLAARLRGGGLGARFGLSAVAGVCVVALWRSWPLWRASAREGGTLGAHWQALDARDASGWHGLGAAACVAAILGSILLLAWPGLLGPQARWAVAGAALVAWPLLHLLLQRLPEPPLLSRPIPVVDMEGEPSSLAPVLPEGDLDRALYAAARAGRVDQALALLEAGADAHGLPLEDERDQRPLAVLAAV